LYGKKFFSFLHAAFLFFVVLILMNLYAHTVLNAEMLKKAMSGETSALEWLYSHYHEHLLGIACRYIPDIEAARDVEHDAWVMILTSFDTLQNPEKLTSWMATIVRNMALNYLKQSHSNQHVPLENASNAVAEPIEETPLPISVPVIQEMVKNLPQGYEQVFKLKTFEGLNHQQIGERLGITVSSSRSQLARARKMLQEMVKQHWALLATLLAVLAPLGIVLITKNDKSMTDDMQPPIVANRPPIVDKRQHIDTTETLPTHSVPANNDVPNINSEPVYHIPTAVTTVSEVAISSGNDAPLAATVATAAPVSTYIAPRHLPGVSPVWPLPQTAKPSGKSRHINMHLAYGGAPNSTASVTDNFLSVINFAAGETQRAMKLYTWSDYYNYLKDNAELMDSIDAKAMRQIADRHAKSSSGTSPGEGEGEGGIDDKTPLSETKHHERPRTVQLSLSMPLSQQWSLSSGLGFTWMKSTFETDNGNDNDITRRTQRLYYLTVPFGATYNIWQHRRWTVYTSGSVQLDIPLHGRETTQYIYTGKYPHAPGDSLVFPTTHATVKAPWQWSVGANVGVQYNVLPHVNAYFEPGFRYYIPTGSPIETYRTAHPFDVALPFGIRIVP
jgi:RNA polymerase sigma-70 factor (ECF subfamily)